MGPSQFFRIPVAAQPVDGKTGGATASSLGCLTEGHRKGARGGREEASEVAGADREKDADQAQATEEDLARQVTTAASGPLIVIGWSQRVKAVESNQTKDTNLIAIAETTPARQTQLIKQPLGGMA